MAEVMNLTLGRILPLPAQYHIGSYDGSFASLLSAKTSDELPPCGYYFDDIFARHESAEETLHFLEHILFPRIYWARLRLSFTKMKLFMAEIKALGIQHTVGGVIRILHSRVEAINEMKPCRNQTQVQEFLGSIGLCRRWINNYSEIARPPCSSHG